MAAPAPLALLYRDEHLVAIDKPAGLLVHKSPVDRHEVHFAVQQLRDQIGQRVYPVHRLDKPTSGVLLFALSASIARQLSALWPEVRKDYIAIVRGFAPASMAIDHPLRPDPDSRIGRTAAAEPQPALTQIQTLAQAEQPYSIETYPSSRYSLVHCQPLSGRRHQLRRHLKHISHPIIGDAKHGKGRHNRFFAQQLDAPGLLLSATALHLQHPVSGAPLHIQTSVSPSIQRIIETFVWQEQLPQEWHAQ